jgi:hypothetical protein
MFKLDNGKTYRYNGCNDEEEARVTRCRAHFQLNILEKKLIEQRRHQIWFSRAVRYTYTELVSSKNLDVLYTWSRNINAFKVKNIE